MTIDVRKQSEKDMARFKIAKRHVCSRQERPPPRVSAIDLDSLELLESMLLHGRSEGAAIMPIYQTATFGYHGCVGERPSSNFRSDYTRPADNPNHKVNLKSDICSCTKTQPDRIFFFRIQDLCPIPCLPKYNH